MTDHKRYGPLSRVQRALWATAQSYAAQSDARAQALERQAAAVRLDGARCVGESAGEIVLELQGEPLAEGRGVRGVEIQGELWLEEVTS